MDLEVSHILHTFYMPFTIPAINSNLVELIIYLNLFLDTQIIFTIFKILIN